MKFFIFLSFVFLGVFHSVNAQDLPLMDGQLNYLKKGDYFYENKAFTKALKAYKKGFSKKNGDSLEYIIRLAEVNRQLHDFTTAEYFYSLVVDRNSSKETLYNYAEVLAANQKYDRAQAIMSTLDDEPGIVADRKKGYNSVENYYSDSLAYSVGPVDFNSEKSDFFASTIADQLVFISSRGFKKNAFTLIDARDESNFLDLYICQPDTILPFIETNDALNQGPFHYIADTEELLITENYPQSVKNADRGKENTLMINRYIKNDNGWDQGDPLPFNNRNYSVAHPSYDQERQLLYFVSNKPGGKGGTDIYRSAYDGSDWSEPENLGEKINTAGDELFPFIDPTTNTLYFSSNGFGGLGGLDIYRIVLNSESETYNLGFPMNSSKDDFAFILSESGKDGFISSNRDGGIGSDDLYTFKIQKLLIRTKLIDIQTSKAIVGTVKVINTRTSEEVPSRINNGDIVFEGVKSDTYMISGLKEGYQLTKQEIKISEASDDLVVELPMKPKVVSLYTGIKILNQEPINYLVTSGVIGKVDTLDEDLANDYVVENLYFPFDESDPIDGEQKLSVLVDLLMTYGHLELEISSFTDCHGPDHYNKQLAQQRADRVKGLLVVSGIDENRIRTIAIGERSNDVCRLGSSCDFNGHKTERRVEFTLKQSREKFMSINN